MDSMRFRRAARFLAILSAPAAIVLPGWDTSGPAGTRATSVSAAPDDDRRAYAAATILESSTSALYRTDDGGRSWTGLVEAGTGDAFSEIFADPRDGNRVFASAQHGNGVTDVYRSDDRGENWGTILSLSTRCVPSFAAGGAPDSLYLTCGTRFLRTPDAGNSWDEPATPFTENVRLAAGPAGVLYAYAPSRLFRSDNLGTSWVQGSAPPAACPSFLSLAADPSGPQVLLAGTGVIGAGGFQCGGVYRSTDGGTSWGAASLSGVYVTDVVFDPAQPNRVYASASFIAGILPPGGVYASTDGGRSFSNARLPATGALELAVSATGRIVYAATALGVYQEAARRPRLVPVR
jgi:photosystem II stability/assembly factor-like uncharacterized protein